MHYTVQQFIASLFRDFTPADFHGIIPRIKWRAIATTNFDLVVERAYEQADSPLQTLVPFRKNGERIEERLRNPESVVYLKLHGCITDISDPAVPLILTPDQYLTHREGRSRLFERLTQYAIEYPIVFVGHSLGDYDLRSILLGLTDLDKAMPRSYIVSPNMSPAESRLWTGRRITPIQGSFEDFLFELDGAIPAHFRILSTDLEVPEHPVFERFDVPEDVVPTLRLKTFLSRDVEYVHKRIKPSGTDAHAFYKGYFVDWSPIIHELDVPRSMSDSIMSEVFLASESERPDRQELYVIKGHAGSGKSVILRRLAWDAAVLYDRFCLRVRQSSFLEYEPLMELMRLAKQRVFIFVDPIHELNEVVEELMRRSRRDDIPITVVGAERTNEWNTSCENLEPYVTESYDVRYLSEREIDKLLDLLETHKSLGYLEELDHAGRHEEFAKRAGRQLLVALHEATLGKPFEDIVYDEYLSIEPQRAKSLYLTVCISYMLGVPVRAGLISRVHKIPFSVFEEELFKPLEFVVFARMNEIIQDYEYRCRHSHIAEIVFERVLTSPQDRFDEILRLVSTLDIDYSSDREALIRLVNARRMGSIFADPQMARQIYAAAHKRDPDSPFLLQQEAIFEMNSPGGSLDKAEQLLQEAHGLAESSKPVAHSLSVLALKRAERAPTSLERKRYQSESKKLATELVNRGTPTAYPYHTIISVELDELSDTLEVADDATIERKIKEVEGRISKAIQLFPDESYLLDANSRFNQLLQDSEKAIAALNRAFSINKRSPYIASRLASIHEQSGEPQRSIEVLKECLDMNPGDKTINFRLALMLMKFGDANEAEIGHHLRRSFTKGDANYAAQFWYARWLYLGGHQEEAKSIFRSLGKLNIDVRIRHKPRGTIVLAGEPVIFRGIISRLEASYGFILRDEYQDVIFAYHRYSKQSSWDSLSEQMRVAFRVAFSYRGPIALSVMPETSIE